ncbi:hypothetical protein CMV_006637 [Castanea mollissima]|uniref:Uncharacterized protein n=1 Tax=Castanea mollissima TaxID=60419 RepID=A0A8J4RAH6_9ROSI|nr:hypothetical protein CMV_006637 [Castanea mollissima]
MQGNGHYQVPTAITTPSTVGFVACSWPSPITGLEFMTSLQPIIIGERTSWYAGRSNLKGHEHPVGRLCSQYLQECKLLDYYSC